MGQAARDGGLLLVDVKTVTRRSAFFLQHHVLQVENVFGFGGTPFGFAKLASGTKRRATVADGRILGLENTAGIGIVPTVTRQSLEPFEMCMSKFLVPQKKFFLRTIQVLVTLVRKNEQDVLSEPKRAWSALESPPTGRRRPARSISISGRLLGAKGNSTSLDECGRNNLARR